MCLIIHASEFGNSNFFMKKKRVYGREKSDGKLSEFFVIMKVRKIPHAQMKISILIVMQEFYYQHFWLLFIGATMIHLQILQEKVLEPRLWKHTFHRGLRVRSYSYSLAISVDATHCRVVYKKICLNAHTLTHTHTDTYTHTHKQKWTTKYLTWQKIPQLIPR